MGQTVGENTALLQQAKAAFQKRHRDPSQKEIAQQTYGAIQKDEPLYTQAQHALALMTIIEKGEDAFQRWELVDAITYYNQFMVGSLTYPALWAGIGGFIGVLALGLAPLTTMMLLPVLLGPVVGAFLGYYGFHKRLTMKGTTILKGVRQKFFTLPSHTAKAYVPCEIVKEDKGDTPTAVQQPTSSSSAPSVEKIENLETVKLI